VPGAFPTAGCTPSPLSAHSRFFVPIPPLFREACSHYSGCSFCDLHSPPPKGRRRPRGFHAARRATADGHRPPAAAAPPSPAPPRPPVAACWGGRRGNGTDPCRDTPHCFEVDALPPTHRGRPWPGCGSTVLGLLPPPRGLLPPQWPRPCGQHATPHPRPP